MRGPLLALVLLLAAPGARADAPDTSIRPMANPAAALVAPSPDLAAAAPLVPHPKPRPATFDAANPMTEDAPVTAALPADPLTPTAAASPRPLPRPADLGASIELASAAEAPPDEAASDTDKTRKKASKKGSVCGDPAIKGEKLAPIKAKVKGCGLDEPVKVTAIDGIRLNQPATISCETAAAMKDWITSALRPAMGNREVVEIRIAASYICRTRNNKKGAKVSEHGRGKAVDVAGFVFADGKQWSVAQDYNKQIRKAHKGACGIFGTTLGPGSDGYHEDHLHFDIARYDYGAYCR